MALNRALHFNRFSLNVHNAQIIELSLSVCDMVYFNQGRRNEFNIGGDTYRKPDRSFNGLKDTFANVKENTF